MIACPLPPLPQRSLFSQIRRGCALGLLGFVLVMAQELPAQVLFPAPPLLLDAGSGASPGGTHTRQTIISGNPAVVYYDTTERCLRYQRALDANGATWGPAQRILVDGSDAGEEPSLAEVNGRPAVTFYDATFTRIMYARATDLEGSSWTVRPLFSGNHSTGRYSSLAVVNGFPAVSYNVAGSEDLRYVRASDVNGQNWGSGTASSVLVTAAGNSGAYNQLLVVNGRPAIAFQSNGGATYPKLCYARANDENGAAWGAVATLDSTNYTGYYNSFKVVDGMPAVAYQATTGLFDLRYVRATDAEGTTWGAPQTLDASAITGQYCSLELIGGRPAVSFISEGGPVAFMRASDSTGGAWGSRVTVGSTSSSAYTSLLEAGGNPAIVFHRTSTPVPRYVRATNAEGTAWGTPVTLADTSSGNVGAGVTQALVGGFPALAYFDTTAGALKYKRALNLHGTRWGPVVTVDATAGAGSHAVLLEVQGRPAIAYQSAGSLDLRYVRAADATGATWQAPLTLDSTGDVGGHTSFALVAGHPAIAYHDATNGGLKYIRAAQAEGMTWGAAQTVDAGAGRGQYTSLCVVAGNPAISHHDAGSENLRYVRALDATGSAWGTPVIVANGNAALFQMDIAEPGFANLLEMDSGTAQNLNAVWAVDANNAWAVGDAGTILKITPAGAVPQVSGTTQNLNDIWGLDANNLWAVGDAGTYLKWDGTSWQALPSPVPVKLRGIHGLSANDIGVVGDAGTVLRWDGLGWMPYGSPGTFYDVWLSPQTGIWAAGDGFVVRHDVSLVGPPRYTNIGPGSVTGVWGAPSLGVVASSKNEWVGHLTFDAMNETVSQPLSLVFAGVSLRGIWGTSKANLWVVGTPGYLGKYNEAGNSWTTQTLPGLPPAPGSGRTLKAIHGADATRAWIVGSTPQDGLYSSLAVVDGRPAIACYDATSRRIAYVRAADSTGSVWPAMSWVEAPGAPSSGPGPGSICLRVINNRPMISYRTASYSSAQAESVHLVHGADAAGTSWDWSIPFTYSHRAGASSSLLEVNGEPALAFQDAQRGDVRYVVFKRAEITVERPAGTAVANGSIQTFSPTFVGQEHVVQFVVRNEGLENLFLDFITIEGADAADFAVVHPTMPFIGLDAGPDTQATLTLAFRPTSGGTRTALLRFQTNDATDNPFTLVLEGDALSTLTDTDGDGLNDAAEYKMASLGFDWQVAQPALVATLMDNAGLAGLYTAAQVQTLHVGTPLLTRQAGTGSFKLVLSLKRSATLTDFQPFAFSLPRLDVTPEGKLEFEFDPEDTVQFFRLEASEP